MAAGCAWRFTAALIGGPSAPFRLHRIAIQTRLRFTEAVRKGDTLTTRDHHRDGRQAEHNGRGRPRRRLSNQNDVRGGGSRSEAIGAKQWKVRIEVEDGMRKRWARPRGACAHSILNTDYGILQFSGLRPIFCASVPH